MPNRHEHHHHHHGSVHPPAAVPLSLLRSSLTQRLALVVGISALLWLCVLWAIG